MNTIWLKVVKYFEKSILRGHVSVFTFLEGQ
jgi:hypothetical protein